MQYAHGVSTNQLDENTRQKPPVKAGASASLWSLSLVRFLLPFSFHLFVQTNMVPLRVQ